MERAQLLQRVFSKTSGKYPVTLKWVAVCAVLGGVFAPLGDLIHVQTGTTGYPVYAVMLWGVPWWVPLLFGVSAISMGVNYPRYLHFLRTRPPQGFGATVPGFITAGVGFLGVYMLSGLLTQMNPGGNVGLNDVLMAVLVFALWWTIDRTWQGLLMGAVNAVAGCTVEFILTRNGIFWYEPVANQLLGLGSWLPWIYVAAYLAIASGYARFVVGSVR